MPPADIFAPVPPIDEIVVPEQTLTNSDDFERAMAVERFVNAALSQDYLPQELPREALIAYWLFQYEGEVLNGGHKQFVGNKGDDPGIFDGVSEGLSILGLDAYAPIFADLCTFARQHPDRFARHYGDFETIDPYFGALDDRFYAMPLYTISTAIEAWLPDRPWITVISDEAYNARIGRLVPEHPLGEARREHRRRDGAQLYAALMAELERDPENAYAYVTALLKQQGHDLE